MNEKEKPPPERRVEVAPRADAVPSAQRCPFCHAAVVVEPADWVACAACLARHHEACWDEGRRCAACAHEHRLRAEAPPRRGWLLPALLATLLVGLVALAAIPAMSVVERPRVTPLRRGAAPPADTNRPVEAARPVEAEAPTADPFADAVSLSHLKPGLRYTFDLLNDMEQVWTVLEVGPNRVIYTIQLYLHGTPYGDANTLSWSYRPRESHEVVLRRETVRVGGATFDCKVAEESGYRSWIPMSEGSDTVWTFPGCVRTEQLSDGAVIFEMRSAAGP